MLETLTEFHARVDGFMLDSLPHEGALLTREPLREKVGPDGSLLPFFGNTMIYDLPDKAKVAIAHMQTLLHHRAADCLAQPLPAESLHMTLHDLLNGTDELALREGMARTGEEARRELAAIRAEGLPAVHLTSVCAFNMVNGSVALGFAPDTEADCATIMALHRRFQRVVALNYPLTPHVTLAYYRPGVYGPETVADLRRALEEIRELPKVHLALTAEALYYRVFRDMQRYLAD